MNGQQSITPATAHRALLGTLTLVSELCDTMMEQAECLLSYFYGDQCPACTESRMKEIFVHA